MLRGPLQRLGTVERDMNCQGMTRQLKLLLHSMEDTGRLVILCIEEMAIICIRASMLILVQLS